MATTRGSLLAEAVKALSVVVPTLTALVTVVVSVLLVRKGQRLAAGVIVAGSLLTLLVAHLAKDAQQRPRPRGEIIYAGGYSFPSTDAALSVLLVAIAIALGSAASGRARRLGLVAASVAVAVFTGVLLISVRVHYLTDVLGGWGLGAALFAACGLLACALDAAAHVKKRGASPTARY